MTFADSNFLVPNSTFIVELVAFLIVLAVIGRYVLPTLKKTLDDRSEKIRAELAAADEAKADAAAADDERRQALEAARHHAREIVSQANRTAEQVTTDAQDRAQVEYDRIVAAATTEVNLARQRAVEESAAQVGVLVLDVVEQIVGREASAEAHRDLIDGAVAALRESAVTGGGKAAGAGATL